jgi:hypothetical protein
MPQSKVELMGYEKADLREGNFIVIGTPVANTLSEFLFEERLTKSYDFPFKVVANTSDNRIEIHHKNKGFYGKIDNRTRGGKDFALITKFRIEKRWFILIMSSLTYGSYEGARAITDPQKINDIIKETNKADCFACIIKTTVYRDESQGPEIVPGSVTKLTLRSNNN